MGDCLLEKVHGVAICRLWKIRSFGDCRMVLTPFGLTFYWQAMAG